MTSFLSAYKPLPRPLIESARQYAKEHHKVTMHPTDLAKLCRGLQDARKTKTKDIRAAVDKWVEENK
jgi:predicted ATP-dependent protease